MSWNQLPYAVECKSLSPSFERIAAFDCCPAAVNYAEECQKSNPKAEYRVTKNGKVVS